MTLYSVDLELPDLTHEKTVELFREWNGDPAYLHLLRFIRVSSADPTSISVVRYGLQEREKASTMNQSHSVDISLTKDDTNDAPHAMALDTSSELAIIERPLFIPGFPDIPASRFSSTMLPMDS
jgi:translation machinery-associated protein 16